MGAVIQESKTNMSEQTQEPTMEEILASIRRIISEDEPGATPAPTEAAAAPSPEPVEEAPSPALMDETPSVQAEEAPLEPAIVEDEEEAPLELTDRFEEPQVDTVGDIEAFPAEPEPAPVAPTPAPVAAAPLAATATSEIAGGQTIDALVRSIVEPQVQQWLNDNLDGLIREKLDGLLQDMVREKLERVFR